MLHPLGVLTEADGRHLALYCVAYARWADAEQHLAEDGPIVKSPTGYPIQNPFLAIANKAMEQMERYMAKLGMNPADRTRIRTDGDTPAKSDLDGFKLRSTA
jgi:P27 family predicted phage terminase small subunit